MQVEVEAELEVHGRAMGRDMVRGVFDKAPGSPSYATTTSLNPSQRPSRAEDDELVQRCREGDSRAFEAIYRRHSISLYNLAYRLVGHASDAEDLLQEIFLQVFNKLSSYRGQAALGTWLYRVATNRCLDHLRSKANRDQAMTESLDDAAPVTAHAPIEAGADRLDLERCIARLPYTHRAAFLLFDVDGYNHREVAQILGVAEGTSKSLVHKARMKIRDCLGWSRRGARK